MKATYRDGAAIISVDERVLEKMTRFLMLNAMFGSPTSRACYPGWREEEAIETARENVANRVNVGSREIVFTSGRVQSNHLAIKGTAIFYQKKGRHIITCKAARSAVSDLYQRLEHEGYKITDLIPQSGGMIDLSELKAIMNQETILVSIMYSNNNADVIQNISEIGKLCRKQRTVFHVDVTQCIGEVPVDLHRQPVDLMSLSSNSLSGPQGVGALYVRSDPRVDIRYGYCGHLGSLSPHKIVGMGEAYRIVRLRT